MALSLANLLTAKFKTQSVDIEGLGTAHVRELSYADRRRFFRAMEEDGADDAAILISSTFCDDSGKLLAKPEDVAGIPSGVALRLYEAAMELNFPKAEEPADPKGD